jgi:D-sedoheptulose 7-phosphate isomerase
MKEDILKSIEGSIAAICKIKEENGVNFINETAEMIANCFEKGGKLIIAGNGGSLCDAMHFAEEFTGFFRKKRKALPAIVLSEAGHLTCVSNDLGYDFVFSRGVEAFGKKDDIFIALTTSGNSCNLVKAVEVAKEMKLKTVSFLGKTGGALKGKSDLEWIVDGFKTSDRIQEAHMAAIHIIIEIVEKIIFKDDLEDAKQLLSGISSKTMAQKIKS